VEQPTEASASKKIIVACLVGAALVLLAHPLFVLLCLAFIGILGLAFFQALVQGKQPAWDNVRSNLLALGQAVLELIRWIHQQVDKHLYPAFVSACEAMGRGCHHGLERVRSYARFLGAVLFEMICGTLVGAILGLIGDGRIASWELTVPVAAGAGAILGILVGVSRRRSSSKYFLNRSGEGLH
jgi:hypothetical protein